MEILDEIEPKGRYLDMSRVNDRILHFVIDNLIIGIISFIIFNILRSKNIHLPIDFGNYIWFVFQFLYYFFTELIFQRSFGKFVRNTKIVNEEIKKPKLWQIFVRSAIRLIPLEFVTLFSSHRRPLHDVLSKTYVVKSIKHN